MSHPYARLAPEVVLDAIERLSPGVTELHLQPAIDTPEVRALTSDATGWIDDHQFLLEPAVREVLTTSGVHLIGYRELRTAMRS